MKVVSVDNRAHLEPAWGFIHFDDRNSAAFTSKDGVWEVGEGGPNWPTATTEAHLAAALAHLEQHGPRVPEDPTP